MKPTILYFARGKQIAFCALFFFAFAIQTVAHNFVHFEDSKYQQGNYKFMTAPNACALGNYLYVTADDPYDATNTSDDYMLYRHDGTKWELVKEFTCNFIANNYGYRGTVYSLYPFNGKIYIAGTFNSIDGIANTGAVAVYDTATNTISAAGSGLLKPNASLFNCAIQLTTFQNKLTVCGNFRNMVGVSGPQHTMAQFDGTQWTAFGSTVYDGKCPYGGMVNRMQPVGDRLYFSGDFVWGDGKELNGIAYWENGTYYDLGGGFADSTENTWCGGVYLAGGEVYTTNYYRNSSNKRISFLTKWTGNAWQTVHENEPDEGFRGIIELHDKLYICAADASSSPNTLMIYDSATDDLLLQSNLQADSDLYEMAMFQNRLYCFGSLKVTGNTNTYTAGYFQLPGISTATAPVLAVPAALTLIAESCY